MAVEKTNAGFEDSAMERVLHTEPAQDGIEALNSVRDAVAWLAAETRAARQVPEQDVEVLDQVSARFDEYAAALLKLGDEIYDGSAWTSAMTLVDTAIERLQGPLNTAGPVITVNRYSPDVETERMIGDQAVERAIMDSDPAGEWVRFSDFMGAQGELAQRIRLLEGSLARPIGQLEAAVSMLKLLRDHTPFHKRNLIDLLVDVIGQLRSSRGMS